MTLKTYMILAAVGLGAWFIYDRPTAEDIMSSAISLVGESTDAVADADYLKLLSAESDRSDSRASKITDGQALLPSPSNQDRAGIIRLPSPAAVAVTPASQEWHGFASLGDGAARIHY